ncbi:efflux RND transporter permease subunit [Legionella oakridgensis]|nr:efflux RND transporter permease subunit [Legionella oakridgensis]
MNTYPTDITFPVITVTTDLPGGDSEIINETITKPIEVVLNTIAGIKTINSSSSPGESKVELQFALGTNMDAVFNEVQSKLNQVTGQFPAGTKSPVIQKESIGATPIMLIGISGKETIEELDEIARTIVQKKLQGLPGVAEVTVVGSDGVVVMVELNLAKMAALNISPGMVKSAFSSQHVQLPGGFVRAGNKQFSLNLDLEFHQLDELERMVVAYRQGAPIYLKDIATLTLTVPDKENVATLNGQTALGINIVKRPEANTVQVVEAVQNRLQEIQTQLPPNVHLKVVYEEAQYILSVVHELEEDTILSIFAAGFVIWLFLRNLRSTLIIVTAIPVSLLGAVLAIYAFGFTLNIITLLGIILLVGVVVDDAIVVLENIYRQMESHALKPKDAAIKGSDQVVFAVLAASLSLVSIFLPVVFMGGTLGLFFKSFAVVVTAGVAISLLISLTLTPVLCARFMRIITEHGSIYHHLERGFLVIETFYKKMLHLALRFRWLMVFLALATVLLGLPVLMTIGKGFLPEERDTGHFQILVQTAQGSSTAYTKSRIADAEKTLAKMSSIETYFSSLSKANSGTINVNLLPEQERKLSQPEIMSAVQKLLKEIPGALFLVYSTQAGGNMSFEVRGEDYLGTVEAAFKLYSVLKNEPTIAPVYMHIALEQPQYRLFLDRVLASSLGLSAEEVGAVTMVLNDHGVKVAKFNKENGNQRHDVVIKADESRYVTPEDLSQIYLINQAGKRISLDTIASFESSLAPLEITRTNQEYSVSFSASPKISLNKAINLVQDMAEKALPQGYTVAMTGDTEALGKTESSMLYTLALILILMYMVLASQFNSFIQPFIIMIAQPLALIGGILILWLTHKTLNIYSMVGALLLMGLVAKNSILLIDLTNQYRERGKSIQEALLEACPLRMRPVLMTSCAIILAMLPAAILPGAASSSHRPLALVIIGGMISSTILTLVIVPAIYSLIEGTLKKKIMINFYKSK